MFESSVRKGMKNKDIVREVAILFSVVAFHNYSCSRFDMSKNVVNHSCSKIGLPKFS
jgi:hypothetical protein